MKRRQFIKKASGISIASMVPGLWMPNLLAATEKPYDGLILMTIFAGGGWDQSSFGDPRNNALINHWARTANAKRVGRLTYAPMAENEEFFKKYYRNMLIINGIDLKTGGHSAADRTQATGGLSSLPTINALFAAIKGKNLPLPWLLSRTATYTEGIQPFTLLPSTDEMRRLTSTNSRSAQGLYYRSSDLEIINQYRIERLNTLLQQQNTLPYTQRKIQELLSATADRGLMGRLSASIPETLDTKDLKGDPHRMVEALHRMLIAAKAGVNVTSSIRTRGNFDSHKGHDANHQKNLTELTRGIDYVWTKAAKMGIDNRLVLHVSSDVGRKPYYNGNAGKDHWSNGSTMIMMKNQNWTNRVVGMSGARHEKINIDPSTLQQRSDGVRVTTAHAHQILRKILGIENHSLAQKYKLNAPPIDFLNPSLSSPVNV